MYISYKLFFVVVRMSVDSTSLSSIFLIIQNMVSRLEEDVALRDRRLSQARAFKERADKEREAATLEREQAKV